APALTFLVDPDTGVYRSGANEISFATGGSQRVAITSAGHLSLNGALIIQDGSAANPGIRFASDLDCGLYRVSSNVIALTTGGSLVAQFGTSVSIAIPTTTGSGTNILTS